jgi:putative transposase
MWQKTDDRLTGLIKQFWLESSGDYSCPNTHEGLREYGQLCGPNKVHRLMRLAGLKAQEDCRKPLHRRCAANIVVPNRLQRRFAIMAPADARVTDLTHIRTHERW